MEECWDLLCLIVKVEQMGFQVWNKETLEANSMAKTYSIASDLSNHQNPCPSGTVGLGGEMDNAIRFDGFLLAYQNICSAFLNRAEIMSALSYSQNKGSFRQQLYLCLQNALEKASAMFALY